MQIYTADDFRAWIGKIASETSLTPSEIARASGLSASTLTRYMHPDYSSVPHKSTIAKIARRFANQPRAGAGFREDPVPFERGLRTEAETLGLDPNAIARKAVEEAIKQKRFAAWIQENQAVFDAKARDADEHGLWCDKYRLF
jgi:post-segregation antitoxin (ccd killing protein)